MDITIHTSSLPHTDPDASLAFYRDTLGFEVALQPGYGRDGRRLTGKTGVTFLPGARGRRQELVRMTSRWVARVIAT